MWYPEILNRMSHFVVDHSENEVTMCSAILAENHAQNITLTEVIFFS